VSEGAREATNSRKRSRTKSMRKQTMSCLHLPAVGYRAYQGEYKKTGFQLDMELIVFYLD
jgi:hypothetical protein